MLLEAGERIGRKFLAANATRAFQQPLTLSTLTAADIAWHMRCYAADLRHEWITPNAILYAWESDLLTVTPDGFVCEVEIKISRSDLLHDLRKPKHGQGMLLNGTFMAKTTGKAHTSGERLEEQRRVAGAERCRRPNYFCFAMPCAVFRKLRGVALPPYAGVYTVDDQGRVFEERRPVQLHTERIGHTDLLALARRMHYRYWDVQRRQREPQVLRPIVESDVPSALEGSTKLPSVEREASAEPFFKKHPQP